MPERRLVRAGLALGVLGCGLLLLPGLVVVVGLVAVGGQCAVFAASLLRPQRWSRGALARGAVVAGILAWPLAGRVDLDATRQVGSEARALNIIHTIQSAEAVYAGAFGYYDSLECLVQGSCMPNTPYPTRYLAPELVRATKTGGYRFLFFSGPKARSHSGELISASGVTSYALVAIPEGEGEERRRAFCGDATRSIVAVASGHVPRVDRGRCIHTEGGATPATPRLDRHH